MFRSWVALALLSASFLVVNADIQCDGFVDGTPCDDSYAATSDDICINQLCTGLCPDFSVLIDGQCVCNGDLVLNVDHCECPMLPLPDLAVSIDCANASVRVVPLVNALPQCCATVLTPFLNARDF
jgi:hypothetical protein